MDDEGRSRVYRTMREFADDERPRERLIEHGAEVLSEAELIAIVVGSGLQGENVIDLSRRISESVGGMAGLARADTRSLMQIRGVGPAKAAQLSAAIELGRRVQRIDPDSRPLLTSPELVYQLLGPRLIGKRKEVLFALALDTRGRLLGSVQPVNGGGVAGVAVRAAEVFREAILLEASSVILAHNHPSGDPRPSPQDVSVTRELVRAGELLDIELQDHVVIGQNSFVSLRREGMAFERQRR
ncbi:MAG: DNA repair protein RadC [Dehalococcoidia bacterium]|nr:DNA repair protein RadC [Dehalococcoidia bacterium]